MRISGAPSVIRKSAADSVNVRKTQKRFLSPLLRTSVLQQLPTNGSFLGLPPDSREDDSSNCKPSNVTSEADPAPGVGEVEEDISILEDDAKAAEGEDRNCRITNAPPLGVEKRRLSRVGEAPGRKKARLGVGLIKPGFKPPAPVDVKSGDSRQLNSANVLPGKSDRFSSVLTIRRHAETHRTTDEQTLSNYYCVMYCTRKLNAKHKGPWSDGVLISRGRSRTLQDTEGQIVTKDNGYRCGDMSEGSTFLLGKFEVEIMKKSTEEEFLSGKIFTETLDLQVDNVINLAHKRSFKSFKRPIVAHSSHHLAKMVHSTGHHYSSGGAANISTTSSATSHSSPTYIPTSKQQVEGVKQILVKEDALVLNEREVQRGATPVVVDPYIASRLRKHQQEGVRFMYECIMGLRNHRFTGCLLADAMGLGKTLQVIALIWTLLHQGPQGRPSVKRVLVICPSSLVENWGKEVRKWLGSERLSALIIHSGTSNKDVKRKISTFLIRKLSPVLVTSYEFLRKYNDELKSAKPELLVCDEAHRLKNCAGNKTIDALLALKCPMKVLLTGTPVQNDLMEFYAMLDFANKDLLGPVSAFKRLYADPIAKSRDRNASDEEKNLGRKRSAELQLRTRPYILQRSSDVNLKYLPVKTELIVFCKLQAPQVSLYQKFLKSKTVETLFHQGSQSAVILSAIGTLRKLCNHPKLVQADLTKEKIERLQDNTQGPSAGSEIIRESDWTLSGKLDCLFKIILAVHIGTTTSTPDKIVVVSNFTQTLDIIQTLCEAQGWKLLRLDGSTEVSDRQTKVDRFNADYGSERVFLLSSKAGGSGLNLIGANRLVLFDPDWNPATDAQAMARVWRDGQKKPVLIYRLLSTGSIEEKIYQRQIMKQEVAAAVGDQVDGQSGHSGRHFSREELRELFTLRLDTRCDTYDLLSQSTVRRTEHWRDYSDELQDYALEKAIQAGVVTFIHKKVEKTDAKTIDCSSGVNTASKISETVTEIHNHCADNDGSRSCSLSQERSRTPICSRQQSPSLDGSSPASRDLSRIELEADGETSISGSRSERISPLFVHTGSKDHEDLRISIAHDFGSVGHTDMGVDDMEVINHHSDGENFADVESDGAQLEHSHLGEGGPILEDKSSLKITCQADRCESTTSLSLKENSSDPVCQSETNCCCLLSSKGHKLLTSILETFKSTGSDLDDLEALDMPFLSSLELELELQRSEFTPQMLWKGIKLFVFGFFFGAKQEQIYYSCSSLGLILDKCNSDKTSTTESVFCKGLPLVISALSRRHGREAVELPTLLSLYENDGQLQITPVGRFLIELTRRCKTSDKTIV